MGGTGLAIVMGLACIVLIVALARSRARHEMKKARRGTEPGQGDQLIDTSYYAGGPGGGHGGVTRVTRDPQLYARAFVPRHAKRKANRT